MGSQRHPGRARGDGNRRPDWRGWVQASAPSRPVYPRSSMGSRTLGMRIMLGSHWGPQPQM